MHTLLASFALAFSLTAAPGQAPTAQKPPEKKPKKVWTNDDLETLRGTTGPAGGVQVTGPAAVPEEKPAGKEQPLPASKDPKKYLEKLGPLRAQLAQLDAQIKQMRNQLANPIQGSNAVDLRHTSVTMRPEVAIKELEDKRRQVQQKIDDLEDEARRNGISPGDIR
jgi:regulator of replication initiation timing